MNKIRKFILSDYFRMSDYLMVILTIFSLIFFVFRDFDIKMLFGFGILGLLLGLNILRNYIFGKIKLRTTTIEIAAVISILAVCFFFLLPNSRKDADTVAYIIALAVSGLYLLFSSREHLNFRLMGKLFQFGALSFAIFILLSTLFISQYEQFVLPILSKTAREYLTYYLNKGYTVAIGGFTYTDYILFIGVAVTVSKFYNSKKFENYKIQIFNKEIAIKRNVALMTLVGLLLFVIFILGRRGEFIAAILSVVILIILLRPKEKRKKELLIIGVVAIILLLVFLLFFSQLENIPLFKRYVFTFKQLMSGRDATSGRLQLYNWAIQLFASNLLIGGGWGSFARVIPASFQKIHGKGTLVQSVHNNYLQILAETGIIGFILIVLPLIYIYYLTIKHLKNDFINENQFKDKSLVISSFLIQTFFILVSFLDPCAYKIIFTCLYAVALKLLSVSLQNYSITLNDPVSRLASNIKSRIARRN